LDEGSRKYQGSVGYQGYRFFATNVRRAMYITIIYVHITGVVE